jgi:8-oxo-dGTP pyrophosphatase MutT (NUDIX family)
VEPEDGSPWAAAIRETWEEIGIDPRLVEPVGRLDPVQVSVSNNLVLPYAGFLATAPVLRPAGPEVDEVMAVPVVSLLDPGAIHEDVWVLRGEQEYIVTYFKFGRHVVWGVTARILWDVARRLGANRGGYLPGSVRPAR